MANWTRADTRALIEAAAERPAMSIWVARSIRRHHGEPGLVEKMARLERFTLGTNHAPHMWGQSDCSLIIADWVALNGHPDPGADWRETYDSEASCRALLTMRGGLVAHVAACALEAGLVPLHEPEFGCIAVIGSTSNPHRQWSAIWQGFNWLVKWGDGSGARWVPFAAKPLGLWRV